MKILKSSKAAMAIAFASAMVIAGCGQNEETSQAAPEADTSPTSSAMQETPATTATDNATMAPEPQAGAGTEATPPSTTSDATSTMSPPEGATSPDVAGSESGTGAAGAGITPPTSGETGDAQGQSGVSETEKKDPQRF